MQQRVNDLLTTYSSMNSFCMVFNPDLQIDVANNEERAILGKSPTLKVIDIAYGEGSAAQWLLPQVHDLSSYCGVKDLEARAARQMAEIIANEYSYLKATELMLFFYRFKAGKYGQFYGRVDPLIIMEALRNGFLPQRTAVIENREKEEYWKQRDQWAKTKMDPEKREQLLKNLEKQKMEEPYSKETAEQAKAIIGNTYNAPAHVLDHMRRLFRKNNGVTPEEYIEKSINTNTQNNM